MGYTNINGKIVDTAAAAIPVDNSAFRYGAGLFETMLVLDGNIRLRQYHWDRLFAGMQQLGFLVPKLFTPSMLEEEVLRTVSKNKLEARCRVRLQVYGGSGGIFGPDDKRPLYVIECYSLEPDTILLNNNGLVVGIAAGISKSNDSLSNLKSGNALVYAMAARQAKENKWNDVLVCNAAGNVIESAIANIFWVKDGTVFTPPLSEGCVAGVMRRHILHAIPGIAETPLTTAALATADEVLLSNAIKGVKWVRAIGESVYGNKQIVSLFADLFQPQ